MLYLKFKSMLFSAVLTNFWVDPFHQSIPFHQHVSKGGTGEYSHNFGANWRKIHQTSSKNPINSLLIHCSTYVTALRGNFWACVLKSMLFKNLISYISYINCPPILSISIVRIFWSTLVWYLINHSELEQNILKVKKYNLTYFWMHVRALQILLKVF